MLLPAADLSHHTPTTHLTYEQVPMTLTPDTAMPKVRRDLLAILVWLAVAALVYRFGHIPGVINSATLIAVGASLWAALKLVAVLRCMRVRVAALVRARRTLVQSRMTQH